MRSSIHVTLFLITFITLGMVHVLATQFHLYWKYVWLDVPIHMLGGICIAFGLPLVRCFGVRIPERLRGLVPTLLTVLLIGILWELYEILIEAPVGKEGFVLDTLVDLSMDLLGGGLGFYIIDQLKRL